MIAPVMSYCSAISRIELKMSIGTIFGIVFAHEIGIINRFVQPFRDKPHS